jgi:hypothetical protein
MRWRSALRWCRFTISSFVSALSCETTVRDDPVEREFVAAQPAKFPPWATNIRIPLFREASRHWMDERKGEPYRHAEHAPRRLWVSSKTQNKESADASMRLLIAYSCKEQTL